LLGVLGDTDLVALFAEGLLEGPSNSRIVLDEE
jgi:hypothetical protein